MNNNEVLIDDMIQDTTDYAKIEPMADMEQYFRSLAGVVVID